ncbi:MAG: helix-turn-helix transcriptional regulator [Bacteroidia bacterium]|nr:helix-turn-helix transcriptional regulator [Bacteroidia bacterium]
MEKQLLKKIIIESELTQKKISIKSNISEQQISRWLSGKRIPKLSALTKIANSLGIELLINIRKNPFINSPKN